MNAISTANIKIKQIKTMYKNGVSAGIKANKLGKKGVYGNKALKILKLNCPPRKMKYIHT